MEFTCVESNWIWLQLLDKFAMEHKDIDTENHDDEKDYIDAAKTQEALLKLNAYIEAQKISLQQEISAIQDDEEVERQVKQLTFRKDQLDSDKNNMLK